MHRTQIRESDVTRQDKEKLVGMGSIAQVQRGEGQIPVAWSSQGRHHCLRGGEEPPGLSGPVEGQGKREQAREAGRAAYLGHEGTWKRQKQTQNSCSDKVPCSATSQSPEGMERGHKCRWTVPGGHMACWDRGEHMAQDWVLKHTTYT